MKSDAIADPELVKAIQSIAHGTVEGPGGLEALAMVLGDIRADDTVAGGLNNVAGSIGRLADAVQQIADHLTDGEGT